MSAPMTPRPVRIIAVAAATAILGLSGCTNVLTTAGSMTIDVEVYKGPLANERHIQWGELAAIVHSGPELVKAMRTQMVESETQLECGRYVELRGDAALRTGHRTPTIHGKGAVDAGYDTDKRWKNRKNCIILATLRGQLDVLEHQAGALQLAFDQATIARGANARLLVAGDSPQARAVREARDALRKTLEEEPGKPLWSGSDAGKKARDTLLATLASLESAASFAPPATRGEAELRRAVAEALTAVDEQKRQLSNTLKAQQAALGPAIALKKQRDDDVNLRDRAGQAALALAAFPGAAEEANLAGAADTLRNDVNAIPLAAALPAAGAVQTLRTSYESALSTSRAVAAAQARRKSAVDAATTALSGKLGKRDVTLRQRDRKRELDLASVPDPALSVALATQAGELQSGVVASLETIASGLELLERQVGFDASLANRADTPRGAAVAALDAAKSAAGTLAPAAPEQDKLAAVITNLAQAKEAVGRLLAEAKALQRDVAQLEPLAGTLVTLAAGAEAIEPGKDGQQDRITALSSAITKAHGTADGSLKAGLQPKGASTVHDAIAAMRVAAPAMKLAADTLATDAGTLQGKYVNPATNAINTALPAIAGDTTDAAAMARIESLDAVASALGDAARTLSGSPADAERRARAEYTKAVDVATARTLLERATAVAGAFRVTATGITFQMASIRPDEQRVRIEMIRMANTAAEFHNQVVSRADALLKQVEGLDRRQLPLSIYLRDSSTTAFVNAYEWFDATVVEGKGEAASHIRGVEQLFNDGNWARINTVYASGQGDVRMAYIKDDIGNWNLKSFDNDPTELVNAYKDLTLAGLEAATEAAAAAASGGSSAALSRSLELAGQLTAGSIGGGASAGGPDVSRLRARVRSEITDLEARLAARKAAIPAERKVLEDETVAQEKVVLEATATVKAEQAKVDDLEGKVAAASGDEQLALAKQLLDQRLVLARAQRAETDEKARVAALEAKQARLTGEEGSLGETAIKQADQILSRYEIMIDTVMETSPAAAKQGLPTPGGSGVGAGVPAALGTVVAPN